MKLLAAAFITLSSAATLAAAEKIITPWSFKPLKRPAVPAVRDQSWARDDLDRFILAKLEAKQIAPNRDADRHTLLRRASLDLTGLPPTLSEIEDFIRDPSPDDQAFAAVVDRLLKSPRFGERWGRHWLDVVRYGESTGRAWNAPFIYAWRYRDWVIDSFNADKPYNRFVAEQIAGDLLPSKTIEEKREQMIGTGLLTLGAMDLQLGDLAQSQMDRIDDQIDVTSRAFLGLTIACARCHDHKYDPITMQDYYALAGVFQSTSTWAGTAEKGNLGPNLYVEPENLLTLPTAKPLIAASKTSPTKQPAAAANMEMMGEDIRDNKGILIEYANDPNAAMGVSEGDIGDCKICLAGNPRDRGKSVNRGEMKLPSMPPMPKVEGKASGRLELAKWITTPTHPLTSRVMANRIWLHLFGSGLVPTVDDFGITGEKPVHPELLDHLAVRFVVAGWSVKKLIRSIMLSRAYRLSAAAGSPANEQADQANELYWRMNRKRLEVEAIRDSLLAAGGDLKFERPAGIPISGNGGKGNTARTKSLIGIDSPYRTVYLPVLRSLLPELHETFDFPEPSQIKGQREVTTVPSQALYFMNSELVVGAAGSVVGRLDEAKSAQEKIKLAYLILLNRQPSAEELSEAEGFLGDISEPSNVSDAETYKWGTLVQAIIASAEFRYAF